MLIWETAAIMEKNRLASDAPFLMLVEVRHKSLPDVIRLARNTEDVEWNGHTWTRFPLKIDAVTTDGKTMPTCKLYVSNAGGLIMSYVKKYEGLTDAAVNIYVVHANMLEKTQPLMTLEFVTRGTSYDENWITWELGCAPDVYNRFPADKYMTNYCPYKFKSVQCGYAGNEACCNNTLKECRIKSRFGGEQGMTGSYA
jgi:phage-related protein